MNAQNHRGARIRAFTLTDLVSVAIIFVIATSMLNTGFQFLRGKAETSRLGADIRALNQAVYLFRASGGDLSDALTPDQVIAKMQATEVDRLTLTINSIIITGLRPIYQTPREAQSEANRAFWNAESQVFEVSDNGRGGIKAFQEDTEL